MKARLKAARVGIGPPVIIVGEQPRCCRHRMRAGRGTALGEHRLQRGASAMTGRLRFPNPSGRAGSRTDPIRLPASPADLLHCDLRLAESRGAITFRADAALTDLGIAAPPPACIRESIGLTQPDSLAFLIGIVDVVLAATLAMRFIAHGHPMMVKRVRFYANGITPPARALPAGEATRRAAAPPGW
ncbi:hypothetical protein [Burkholderia glumae]|uniref:hypothetical protein n=1 Tax=Burkholderia glumae TaxID=337 RepID=UPI0012F728F0|nr:hypothetical protein [Burkholderia glumae]MCM2494985.1 hypothetical protein [Burkholderia glumae]MCM2545850.1 hypothetical protein [Burkholderia glumae]